MTIYQIQSELDELNDRIARIIADVRGVVPQAMADRRERLEKALDMARRDAVGTKFYGGAA